MVCRGKECPQSPIIILFSVKSNPNPRKADEKLSSIQPMPQRLPEGGGLRFGQRQFGADQNGIHADLVDLLPRVASRPSSPKNRGRPSSCKLWIWAVWGSSSKSSALPRQAPLESCTTSLAQSSRNVIRLPSPFLFCFMVCGAAALDADRAVVLYWELETIGNANHKDRGTSNVQKHRI